MRRIEPRLAVNFWVAPAKDGAAIRNKACLFVLVVCYIIVNLLWHIAHFSYLETIPSLHKAQRRKSKWAKM